MSGHDSKRSGIALAFRGPWPMRGLGLWAIITLTMAGASITAPARAAPPGTSDPTLVPSLHETRLAVQARNALVADPALAPLVDSSQIGVRVRQNVATLFGSVPSQEIADKAMVCLRGMQKLLVLADIRSELEIVVPTLDPRTFKDQVDKEKKSLASPAKPTGELASLNGDTKPLAKKKTTTASYRPSRCRRSALSTRKSKKCARRMIGMPASESVSRRVKSTWPRAMQRTSSTSRKSFLVCLG